MTISTESTGDTRPCMHSVRRLNEKGEPPLWGCVSCGAVMDHEEFLADMRDAQAHQDRERDA